MTGINLSLPETIRYLTLLGVPESKFQDVLNNSQSKFGRLTKNSLETSWNIIRTQPSYSAPSTPRARFRKLIPSSESSLSDSAGPR